MNLLNILRKMKGLQVPISIEELEKVYESQPFFEQDIGTKVSLNLKHIRKLSKIQKHLQTHLFKILFIRTQKMWRVA